MEIKHIDNFKNWGQIKKAAKEKIKCEKEFKKKYNQWNYPGFSVAIFFEKNEETDYGEIDLSSMNLTTGEVYLEYHKNQVIECKKIYVREFFKNE